MALPILSGRGLLLAKDGIDFKFAASGIAVARFGVAFEYSKKDEYGEWQREKEIIVNATAFGELAEYINNNFSHATQIELDIEVELAKFQRNNGEEGQAVQGIVRKVGAPIVKREANVYG